MKRVPRGSRVRVEISRQLAWDVGRVAAYLKIARGDVIEYLLREGVAAAVVELDQANARRRAEWRERRGLRRVFEV